MHTTGNKNGQHRVAAADRLPFDRHEKDLMQ